MLTKEAEGGFDDDTPPPPTHRNSFGLRVFVNVIVHLLFSIHTNQPEA